MIHVLKNVKKIINYYKNFLNVKNATETSYTNSFCQKSFQPGVCHSYRILKPIILMQVPVPHTVRPNKLKWSLELRKVYCRATQGDTSSCPKKLRGLLKARGGKWVRRSVISLYTTS